MSRSERSILAETLCKVSAMPETLIYRQNTGQAWTGRPVNAMVGSYLRVEPGMKILAQARPIDFGLAGAGDACGVSRGRAVQIEMKTLTGRQREVQQHFERAWVKAGGIYILARDADTVVNHLK
jgi:outer membrane lipoprotein SlyB